MSRGRILVALAALALGVMLLNVTLVFGFDTAHRLLAEDGLYENTTALALLGAGVLFFMAFRRSANRPGWTRLSRLFVLAMALLWVFGAGEEISWGQRIFGFGPTDAAINRQEETNIHNLRVLYDGAPVRPYRLFTLFWFSIVFAVPVIAALYEPARRFISRYIPIFPWALGGVFIFNEVFSKVVGTMLPGGSPLWDQFRVEIRETNLALLALATGFYLYRYMLAPEPAALSAPVKSGEVTLHTNGAGTSRNGRSAADGAPDWATEHDGRRQPVDVFKA